MTDERYNVFDELQWSQILSVLAEDVRTEKGAFSVVAPSYPEAGQEPWVYDELQTDGMVWISESSEKSPLSERILPNCDDVDESARMIRALENTLAVLRAHHNAVYG